MSPPEVWGPAVWTLIHALTVRINDDAYAQVSLPLFKMIVNICKFLPCPECSTDASNFLAKVQPSQLKTKPDLINTFYFFHNSVNAKKHKPLFKYSNLGVYGTYRLIGVVNNFIAKYNTKGNMKLIAESFQRQMILNQFRSWFVGSIRAFIPKMVIPPPLPSINNGAQVETIAEPVSEPIVEPVSEPIVEPVSIVEPVVEPIVEPLSEPVAEPLSEPVSEPIVEPVSEPVSEPVTDPIVEPASIAEPIVEPIVKPVAELIVEPVAETVSEPVAETVIEPVSLSDGI